MKVKKKLQLGGPNTKEEKTQSVISMLKKRQSTDLKVKRVMESGTKVQKVENSPQKEGKGTSVEKSQPVAPNVCQITSFFSKRPGPSSASPQTLKNSGANKKVEKDAPKSKSSLSNLLNQSKPTNLDASAPVPRKEGANKSAPKGKAVRGKPAKEAATLTKRDKATVIPTSSVKAVKPKKGGKLDAELKVKKGKEEASGEDLLQTGKGAAAK